MRLLATGCVMLLAGSVFAADPYSPKFFAFQNGVRFRTADERIKVLKELGYDGIGSANLGDLDGRTKKYRAAGMSIFSIYTGITLSAKGAKIPPGIETAAKQLKGTDTVIELFVGGRSTDEHAVAAIRKVAAIAKANGLQVVLYPHSGCYVDHMADAVRLAKKVDRKNVGVMFNLCHYLMVEPKTDLKTALKSAGPLLRRVSICGAERGGRGWKTLIQPLDRGNFDQVSLLRLLRELKYRGPIGLQCYGIGGDARKNLARSLAAWKKALKELNSK